MPFPNYKKSHVFECPKGHVMESGNKDHHDYNWRALLCGHCRGAGVKQVVVKCSCPPGCPNEADSRSKET